MNVWAISSSAIEERTVGLRQVPDHPPGHLHRDGGCGGDLLRHLPHRLVELVGRDDARHDPVGVRLVGTHRPAGEHHVGGHAVTADLVQPPDPAGVGDHAVRHLGQHEPRTLGGDADVAQQRPLERRADRPALHGDDDRRFEVEDLQDAAVATAHELVVGQLDVADRRWPTRRAPTRTTCPRRAR